MIRPTYVRARVGSRMSGSWLSATTSVFFCAWAASVSARAASALTMIASPLMILGMVSSSGIRIPAPGGRDGAHHTSRGWKTSHRLVAKLHLLDLARARHREVVDEDDVARDLEAGDPALALREHLAVGERVAGLAPHERDAHFRHARVGKAHDRGQVDSGETHQERFDLHGVDVLAADLQHVLVPPDETQVTVAPHDAHVARVQPALAVERLRGLRGLAVVALHGHVAPYEDLAGHVRRLIQPARGIDDSNLVARRRVAGRLGALLLGRLERAERGDHPELAHPVSREEPAEHRAR